MAGRTYALNGKKILAKANAFAEIKEIAAAELGKLSGMLNAQPRFAGLVA